MAHCSIRYQVGDITQGASPVDFILRYKGPLPANSGPAEKHKIRQQIHPQLKNLWSTHPLLSEAMNTQLIDAREGKFVSATRVEYIAESHPRGPYCFVPLVSNSLSLVCSLDIQMLRREPPGSLIEHGGDIDNRIKTLFDTLRIPDEKQVTKMTPEQSEVPFFCLLEDDSLITGFCVKTERLLDPLETTNSHEQHYIALHINVKVNTTLASETEAFNRLKGTRVSGS